MPGTGPTSSATIAAAAARLPARQALLDGEIAVLLPNGTTSFQALQNAARGRPAGAALLLRLRSPPPRRAGSDGRDARGAEAAPWRRWSGPGATARSATAPTSWARARSSSARPAGSRWRASCPSGATGPYEPGRGRSWLKVKCIQEQEFVVGGLHRAQGDAHRPGRPAPRGQRGERRPRLRREGRHRLHRVRGRAPPRAARPAAGRASRRSRAGRPAARRPAG